AHLEKQRWAEYSSLYSHFANLAYRVAQEQPQRRPQLARQAFHFAQRLSRPMTSADLEEMAARNSGSDPRLAALIRELQDLQREAWKLADLSRATGPDQRDAVGPTRKAELDTRIAELKRSISDEFPNYERAKLRQMPASVEDVQAFLGNDEALV